MKIQTYQIISLSMLKKYQVYSSAVISGLI